MLISFMSSPAGLPAKANQPLVFSVISVFSVACIAVFRLKYSFSQLEWYMAGKSQKTQTFEAALAELEQVVADMEGGKLPLEESLAAYQRGAELLQLCRSRLDDAQQQVRILEDGNLQDFASGTGKVSGTEKDVANNSLFDKG